MLHELVSPVERDGNIIGYQLKCPGCDQLHFIYVRGASARLSNKVPEWEFNGDIKRPTFSPSLLLKSTRGESNENHVCHSFIRDGNWQFLNDCTHDLAGKTVPMVHCDD